MALEDPRMRRTIHPLSLGLYAAGLNSITSLNRPEVRWPGFPIVGHGNERVF